MTSAASRRLAVLVVVAAALTACGGAVSIPGAADASEAVRVPGEGGNSYTDVTPAKLVVMMDRDDLVLVNVNVPYEGEIEGTEAFVPYDQVAAQLDRLPADRSETVVVYCRSGSMSAIAARELVARGYVDVRNLAGGMNAWQAQGFPLISELQD